MFNTAQSRSTQPQRRNVPVPSLWDGLPEGALADKGPKHIGFDAPFLGAGRRAVERALRQDRKR